MEKEKNNHGGRREGAGRKAKVATSVAFRLEQSLYDRMVALADERGCSKTEVLEDALKKYFNI